MPNPPVPPPLRPVRPRSNAMDDGGHRAAIATIDVARREALQRIFAGTHLGTSKFRVAKIVSGIAKEVKAVKTSAKKQNKYATSSEGAMLILAKIKPSIHADIMNLFDGASMPEIIAFLGPEIVDGVTNALAEATPFLGIAKTGVSVVSGLIRVAADVTSMKAVAMTKDAFAPGDAQAAVAGLERLIEREIKFNSVALARDTISMGAKAAGAAMDFGTASTVAIGLVNGVVALIENLAAASIDFRERNAANAMLRGTPTLTVFSVCPITACYFITCASTSDILNIAPSRIGTAGFQSEVEALRKRILIAQKRAALAIESSRFVLLKGGEEVKPHMNSAGGLSSFDNFKRQVHHFNQSVRAALP